MVLQLNVQNNFANSGRKLYYRALKLHRCSKYTSTHSFTMTASQIEDIVGELRQEFAARPPTTGTYTPKVYILHG